MGANPWPSEACSRSLLTLQFYLRNVVSSKTSAERSMSNPTFANSFRKLTGNDPFPWQQRLFDDFFAKGMIPAACTLPTGLGKTAIIAIWLIARANGASLPRRLIYVVNRRTVVDQTTIEVVKYKQKQKEAGIDEFEISTLRGQHADNREWSKDPSQPAVICGTVDMIGSRLLFSGYGVGVKAKPLHAGFLGQDTLLIHDEAHLEPAFQTLIEEIQRVQEHEPSVPWPKLRVMELTATSRNSVEQPFGLNGKDWAHPDVQQRVAAKKPLNLILNSDPKKLANALAELALVHKESNSTVLIFARTVNDVLAICEKLKKEKVHQENVHVLTGTMRGFEREEMANKEFFKRFQSEQSANGNATTYLVCTAAGEVGVNISANFMVCDLSTFESMAQRFGRVNRFGTFEDCRIDVVHPTSFDVAHKTMGVVEQRREATLKLLQKLDGVANSQTLDKLSLDERTAAFVPTPVIPNTTDMLFDAWALTTIKGKMPGRPDVEPFLHGIADWQPPETQVAWRDELDLLVKDELLQHPPEDLLEAFPLRPWELLRETSERAFKAFELLAQRHPDSPAWIISHDGTVEVVSLKKLTDKDAKDRIHSKTVILPPKVGGLAGGMLDGKSPIANDVSEGDDRIRIIHPLKPLPDKESNFRLVQRICFDNLGDDEEAKEWLWFVKRSEGGNTSNKPVAWDAHVKDVETHAKGIVERLNLPADLQKLILLAAEYHDHGKRRILFQRMLGNDDLNRPLAKSGGKKGLRMAESYRHEFGSLFDITEAGVLENLTHNEQDLVLHLIATHHGRARPHFPIDEVYDPEPKGNIEAMALEVPRRFARLQRRYGRWGLAYLESLLRAADWAASESPSKYLQEEK